MAERSTANLAFVQSDTAKTTHTSVSVGASSATIAAANPHRTALYISNDHASQILYLSLGGTAEANKGIRVNAAGGLIVITHYTGQVNGIATGASTPIGVCEV